MFDVIGFIVISLSRCCLPNDDGPAPPPKKYFFLEPPLTVPYFDHRLVKSGNKTNRRAVVGRWSRRLLSRVHAALVQNILYTA